MTKLSPLLAICVTFLLRIKWPAWMPWLFIGFHPFKSIKLQNISTYQQHYKLDAKCAFQILDLSLYSNKTLKSQARQQMAMEKAKALNILKSLWMTKLQMMVHMFTSYLRSLMQLHHGNIWPIIFNIQKMKKSITLNWNPCQNEKLIIPQRFSVKLSLSICCARVVSAKQLCKSMLPRSILYYIM